MQLCGLQSGAALQPGPPEAVMHELKNQNSDCLLRCPTMRQTWSLFFSISATLYFSAIALGQTVVYPRAESAADERSGYPIAVLKLSLEKSGRQYTLQPSEMSMPQARSLRLLAGGGLIDIVWTVTSKERESEFLPIRIPIDRGLIGWRLLLIRQQDEQLFAGINDAHALAALRAGQGHDWPDTDVLLQNQFSVVTSSNYESLFSMLVAGHIQYFPRSVNEIFSEIELRPKSGLEIEKNIALHYPEALYFFVNKRNTDLADAIVRGMRKAIADGSLQDLFSHYFSAAIARADLSHKRVISLDNPGLPPETPLSDQTLWFDPLRKN
jgi:Bacterial extracellular solute-binding proteins, family 3